MCSNSLLTKGNDAEVLCLFQSSRHMPNDISKQKKDLLQKIRPFLLHQVFILKVFSWQRLEKNMLNVRFCFTGWFPDVSESAEKTRGVFFFLFLHFLHQNVLA